MAVATAQEAPPSSRTFTAESARKAESRAAYLFLAPYLILFGVFVILPAALGIWMSLHDYDFTLAEKPFVGLENYTGLFNGESPYAADFWMALRATWIFTILSVPLLLVLPLCVALVLNQKFRGRNFFRAVYFAPYMLGVAVVAVLWRYLLDTNIGLINYYLGRIIPWLTSVPEVWISLVLVTVWWTLGFNTAIYLAALQEIPASLYEAASIDGANAWHKFRYVTMPGLRPVLLFVVSTTIIASVNMFGQSYLMTQGGPGNVTRTGIMYIAEVGLRQFNSGAAAAMSMVFTVFLTIVSILVFWLFQEREGKRRAEPAPAEDEE